MSERVLLIDDEDYVLRALRGHLAARVESGDLAVAVAVDGPDAVAKARKSAEEGNPFDLAVIDFQMTDEMNGLETLGELRKHLPDIVGLMLTGHAQQNTPVAALNLGFRYYLVKPVTREAFLAAVDEQVRQIRLAKRNRRLQAALARFHGTVQQILSTIQSVAAMTGPVELSTAAADVVECAVQLARAADGYLLLIPPSGDRYLVHDRRGKTVDDPAVSVSGGLIAMAAGAGTPVVRAADMPGGLAGPDVGPLEKGRKAAVAVPVVCGPRPIGALLLLDPVEPQAFGQYERGLSLLGRIAGPVIDSVRAEGKRRGLLLGALRAGLAAVPGAGTGEALLEQLQTSIQTLEGGLQGSVQAAADADLDAETRTALEMAAGIREIARYGPEGLEFCRSMIEQFRAVLRSYCE
jgi:DNA-binding response OmpR family regulator